MNEIENKKSILGTLNLNKQKFFNILFLALAIWVIYFVWNVFLETEANIKAALITFIAAVISVLYTQVQTQKREIKSRHFIDKKNTYLNFINLVYEMFKKQKEDQEFDNNEIIQRMMDFKKELLVWGAPQVIEAYMKFENAPNDMDALHRLLIVDNLYREIRKDLGHDDSQLPKGALVTMQIIAEDREILMSHPDFK